MSFWEKTFPFGWKHPFRMSFLMKLAYCYHHNRNCYYFSNTQLSWKEIEMSENYYIPTRAIPGKDLIMHILLFRTILYGQWKVWDIQTTFCEFQDIGWFNNLACLQMTGVPCCSRGFCSGTFYGLSSFKNWFAVAIPSHSYLAHVVSQSSLGQSSSTNFTEQGDCYNLTIYLTRLFRTILYGQ